MDGGAAPLFRMEGVSKRYGGVRALEKAELAVEPGRIHAILGENGAGKSTLIKVMAGVVAAGRRPHDLRRPRRDLRRSRRRQRRRHRLHLPGALADPRAQRRRQHPHFASAQALRPDRPAGAAEDRRGSAGPRRRRRHPSEGAGEGPAAVAPADRRDRQGARPQAAHPDPRRSHLGADRGRRRQGFRGAEAPSVGGAGPPLHLAPHARDRRAGGRMHRLPQRPQRRDLQGRHQDRQRSGRDDDRPRIQPRLPAQAHGDAERPAAGAGDARASAGASGCATSPSR